MNNSTGLIIAALIIGLALLAMTYIGNKNNRFEFVQAGDSKLYKADNQTGNVWYIFENKQYEIVEISDNQNFNLTQPVEENEVNDVVNDTVIDEESTKEDPVESDEN